MVTGRESGITACVPPASGRSNDIPNLVAMTTRLQGFPQQFFVIVRPVGSPVHFSRIEKGITHLHGVGQQLRHFFLVGRRTVGMAHAHAAQTYGGDSQSAQSQYPVFHISYPF